MRILLVGEYSRLHNSLKEGLIKLGYEVIIVSNGDGFKNYPSDIFLKQRFTKGFSLTLRKFFLKIFSKDISSIDTYIQFKKHRKLFIGFDIVQLINESPFNINPKTEIKILDYIFHNNKYVYLLSCGNDYTSIKYAFDKKFRYSILTPFHTNKTTKKEDYYSLKYLTSPYKKLHNYIFKNCNGVIASDLDYHIPLLGNSNYLGLIPNPINIAKIKYIPINNIEKIKIFHGVNNESFVKKGSFYFTKALEIIKQKYNNIVDIKTSYSLPYNEYIKLYDDCHILLDQVYSYDQGYNALEAMAKGKVVFYWRRERMVELL